MLASAAVDAAAALADLTEISSHVEAAVILADDGRVLASTLREEQARAFAHTAAELLAVGKDVRKGSAGASLARVEAATREGSVFVVSDGTRTIAATTAPAPPVGLVFYDLETSLRALAEVGRDGSAATDDGDAA